MDIRLSRKQIAAGVALIILLYGLVGPMLARLSLPLLQLSSSPEHCKIIVTEKECCGSRIVMNEQVQPFYQFLRVPSAIYPDFSDSRQMCDCAQYIYQTSYSTGRCSLERLQPITFTDIQCRAEDDTIVLIMRNTRKKPPFRNISHISVHEISTGDVAAYKENLRPPSYNITKTIKTIRIQVELDQGATSRGIEEHSYYGVTIRFQSFADSASVNAGVCKGM